MPTLLDSSSETQSPALMRWGLVLAASLALLFVIWRITGRTLALAADVTPVPYARSTNAPFSVALVPSATPPPSPTATLVPTQMVPTMAATPTTLPSPTPPPVVVLPTADSACALYQANLDLLTPIVNHDVELSRDYQPTDLETPQLAYRNAYIVPITVRNVVLQSLYDLLAASNQAGMQVMVVSGFRSWSEQQLAYDKWTQLYPDRAPEISALPGHSEHQLGTVVDFSAPYMEDLYQNLFHTNFFHTPEGQWLNDNAAGFGFTLSYPSWGTEVTQYAWEPWHFRYVGVALAQELADRRLTLSEYIAQCSSG